jgi:hypothetical protein
MAMGKYVYDWPRPMVTVDVAVFAFFGGLPQMAFDHDEIARRAIERLTQTGECRNRVCHQ